MNMKERIKKVLDRAKRVSRKVGRVQAAVLLSIFYYTIFGIVALLLRCVKRDLLDMRWSDEKSTYWLEREKVDLDISRFERQF